MINSGTKVIALIGNPIKHSLSPMIQNYFISEYSRDAVYLSFEIKKENIREAFNGAKTLGIFGLNVTMPYKEEMFGLIDNPDRVSSIIKSVNTVKFDHKKNVSEGFNTDVEGFLISLDKKKFKWKGSQCLVIGAGGAARSTIYGILQKNIKRIFVYNRTTEKINYIIKDLKSAGSEKIRALNSINDLSDEIKNIDLIVNCTPVGMDIGSNKDMLPVPESWNLRGKFIFDMVYRPVETRFLKKAREEGAMALSGIDLLINQAALSFEIWFGILPQTDAIKEKVLDSI
ncbi:MAG: shikimate dehydrogenase [Actinomycetota bacterium]|nr:shikimate dehydrogenase [Actinomycetota bacterium]